MLIGNVTIRVIIRHMCCHRIEKFRVWAYEAPTGNAIDDTHTPGDISTHFQELTRYN